MDRNRVAVPPNPRWWLIGGLYAFVVVGSLIVAVLGTAEEIGAYRVVEMVPGWWTVAAWAVFISMAWMDVEAVRVHREREDDE